MELQCISNNLNERWVLKNEKKHVLIDWQKGTIDYFDKSSKTQLLGLLTYKGMSQKWIFFE